MIDALQPRDGAVVFDETIHGFSLSPDLWKALLAFPLNPLTPDHLVRLLEAMDERRR